MTNIEFIETIGQVAIKYYDKYKILPSLTIAQAILESGYGKTQLAKECYNYFGMKWVSGCNCAFKTYPTKEQRADGTVYTINAKFRKYDNLEDGIKGYYDFLQYARYKNLKGVTDYKVACNLIRLDGWATDINYTNKLIKLIEQYNLTRYNKPNYNIAVVEDIFSIDGKNKKVHKILIQNENYVRLRDLEDVISIVYNAENKKVSISKKEIL